MKSGKNSGFPIDESAVTIEGEDFETVEVEHREIIADAVPVGVSERGQDSRFLVALLLGMTRSEGAAVIGDGCMQNQVPTSHA